MTKFEELKKDILNQLQEETSCSIVVSQENDLLKYKRRLASIDETTIKYLMKLTNDYIRAVLTDNKYDIGNDLDIFHKYGFAIENLDEKIKKIEYPYNAYGSIWPGKIQEEVMQTVFNFFQCPGVLPKVDDILAIAAKFGVTYGTENDKFSRVYWIDTRNFDDPYNTGDYFLTALMNGLSIDEIIMNTYKITSALSYYVAPMTSGNFSKGIYKTLIIGIVPFLDEEYRSIYSERAKSTRTIYEARKEKLALQIAKRLQESQNEDLKNYKRK